jgi:hypothetical protein
MSDEKKLMTLETALRKTGLPSNPNDIKDRLFLFYWEHNGSSREIIRAIVGIDFQPRPENKFALALQLSGGDCVFGYENLKLLYLYFNQVRRTWELVFWDEHEPMSALRQKTFPGRLIPKFEF